MSDATNDLFAGYLTEDEQAELLKKTKRTIRGWRKKRQGPPWTTNGKEVLYHIEWNREWLTKNKVEPVRERRRRQRADDRGTVRAGA